MSQLMQGEREIVKVHQHWSVLLAPYAIAAAVLVVGLVAIQLVPSTILGHDIADIKHILDAIDIGVVLLIITVRYLQWRFSTYVLTSHRIIVSRGVVARVTESINLSRIQETVVRQGLVERMFGCGSMEVTSAGRDSVEVIYRIPRPQEFYNSVGEAMEADRFATPQGQQPAAGGPPGPPPPPSQ